MKLWFKKFVAEVSYSVLYGKSLIIEGDTTV